MYRRPKFRLGAEIFVRASRAFAHDRAGAVHIIFAVALVPLTLAVGAAVDYSRANRSKAELQGALDSAVLAGAAEAAKGAPLTGIPSYVGNFTNANFSQKGAVQVSATASADGVVAATASLPVDTVFIRMLGMKTMDVSVTSQALFGAGKAEIALALDTTGSMAGAKITAARQAANGLVDTLYSNPSAAQNVKIALVPFTSYVNVGLTYRNASWISGANDYSTTSTVCWTSYPNAKYLNPYQVKATCYADGVPYDCSYTAYKSIAYGQPVKTCSPVTYSYTWYGCVGSRAYPLDLSDTVGAGSTVPALLNYTCSKELVRLTNSASAVKTQINALSADGETYIAPGLLWAWRVLSPNAPFADGQPYGKGVAKTIVLMTDGANTHSPNYPYHDYSDVAVANYLTAKTCANAKAAGIRIMTIAFEVTDAGIKKILADCATSASDYYDAGDIASMSAAFKSIGVKLTGIRLTK